MSNSYFPHIQLEDSIWSQNPPFKKLCSRHSLYQSKWVDMQLEMDLPF